MSLSFQKPSEKRNSWISIEIFFGREAHVESECHLKKLHAISPHTITNKYDHSSVDPRLTLGGISRLLSMAFIIILGISKLFLKINRKNYISNKTRTPSTFLTHFGKISAQPHTIVKQICFPMAMYCFSHCFLYSRTECIMKYGAVRKFYPHFLTSTCQVNQQTLFQEASIERPWNLNFESNEIEKLVAIAFERLQFKRLFLCSIYGFFLSCCFVFDFAKSHCVIYLVKSKLFSGSNTWPLIFEI